MIADAIDSVVVASRQEGERLGFWASDFGYCHRRMILQRAGIKGRPRTVDSLRTLDERQLLHDHKVRQLKAAGICIAGDAGTAWTNAHATTRLSEGLPDGFGCRADAIIHPTDCCRQRLALTVAWGRMYNYFDTHGTIEGCKARAVLARHKLYVLEIKTSHPNIMRYSNGLPKPENVLQARTAAYAIKNKYGLDVGAILAYFAVGSGARPMEFIVAEPGDSFLDVQSEIETLKQEWLMYAKQGILPDVLPLQSERRKEGDRYVHFMVPAWECTPLYCPYAASDDNTGLEFVCLPRTTKNKGGDRYAFERDGQVIWSIDWCERAGISVPPGVPRERT